MKLKLKESQTRVKKDQARIGFVDGKLVFTASAISHSSSICFVSTLLQKVNARILRIPSTTTQSNNENKQQICCPITKCLNIIHEEDELNSS